jgi:hypothetical protein
MSLERSHFDPLSCVSQLTIPDQRESALLELSKKREAFSDLAPILWHSFGTISALLQEIISIYPMLSPPNLTAHASNRVCNALALLQCVASHPETRRLFLDGMETPLFTNLHSLTLHLTPVFKSEFARLFCARPLFLFESLFLVFPLSSSHILFYFSSQHFLPHQHTYHCTFIHSSTRAARIVLSSTSV